MRVQATLKGSVIATLVTIALLVAGSAERVAAEAFIVRDGKPNAQIVIAEKPTRMQNLAAEELQKYVTKITGAELPITSEPTGDYPVNIYVGESRFMKELGLENDDLVDGGFLMKSGKDWLALLGRDDDYFRETPADGGPVYPRNRGDRKRAAEAWQKKYGDKWASHLGSSFKAYHEGLGLWSLDEHGSLNAVNEFLRSLGVRWYMPGDFGEVCPAMTSIPLPKIDKIVRPEFGVRTMMFYYNAPFMASEDEFMWQLRLGFHPNPKVRFGHGLAYALSSDDNPEFYAHYGDERANKKSSRHRKPCLSSEGLLYCAVERAGMMADDFGVETVSMMPTDGYTYFCQCDKCEGKDTPERGYTALMSDYVWDFINRAAKEVAKTHPDVEVWCQAYGSFRLSPLKIKKFHPNVAVSLAQARHSYHAPERREYDLAIRKAFLENIPSKKFYMNNKYSRFAAGGVPGFCPHRIAEDIKSLKGYARGENMEVRRGYSSGRNPAPDPLLAANHLNCWVTARYWIDPDLDIDAVLDDYYDKFYGPAAGEMKTFVEFCENSWWKMNSDVELIDKAFTLVSEARKAAGDGIEGKRVQWIMDSMQPLKERCEVLRTWRQDVDEVHFVDGDKSNIKLDGKIDDPFWKDVPEYQLGELKTGGPVKNSTTVKMVWADNALYFAIRCEDDDMANLNVPAAKDGSNLVFSGDAIEFELDPPEHSGYYQIAIDPDGHVNDLDRVGAEFGKKGRYRSTWESGIEVATSKGDDHWTLEAKVPVLGANQEDLNANFAVSGNKPTKQVPWHINVCRNWRREGRQDEASALSPNEGERGFHNMRTFARLTPKGNNKK